MLRSSSDPHVKTRACRQICSVNCRMQSFLNEVLKMEKNLSIKSDTLPVLYFSKRSVSCKRSGRYYYRIQDKVYCISSRTCYRRSRTQSWLNNHLIKNGICLVPNMTNHSWDTQPCLVPRARAAYSTTRVVNRISRLANVCIVIYLFIEIKTCICRECKLPRIQYTA